MSLLDPRLWLALVLALAAAYGSGYFKGDSNGRKLERVEHAARVASANAEALRLERARQSMVDNVARLAAARTARILADAASARGESDGLRGDLDAANKYAKESRAAAERVAEGATGLLGRCTAAYLGVAESAARADSEARELRQGWPTDSPP